MRKEKRMKERMKKTSVLMGVAVGVMFMQCGCGSKEMTTTGFLTDYSRLEKESKTSLRYVNESALGRYSHFIVDPVEVHFYSGAKSKGKLTDQQLTDLANYMYSRINQAVTESGNDLTYQPAEGVARIRVALTDINKTSWLNISPYASVLQFGVGNVSMETEIIDSGTGEQIGAVVETQKGSRIPFTNLGSWTAARKIMDAWGKRLKERLEEVR